VDRDLRLRDSGPRSQALGLSVPLSVVARTLATVFLLVLLAGCGGGSAPPPRPQQPVPRPGAADFIGIYSDDVFFGDAAYRRATLTQEHAAGVQVIRQPLAWADFERDPANFDDFVGLAAGAGVRVLPILLGPEPGAPAAQGGMAPPSSDAKFAAWAASVVGRYGPSGSFWRARPSLRKLPVTAWQVWNEPNIPAFWAPRPDPAAYAQLLRTTAAAIRKRDQHAEVVTAGLPTSHLGMSGPRFLEAVYAAGAKGSFDTVAVHPYAPTPDAVLARVRSMRRVIVRHKDDAKLWITEFGWGTGGKPGPLTVTPPRQASYLSETLALIGKDRAALGLRGAVVFQWRDPKPYPGRREIWPFYAGLLDVDGKPKPGLAAFTKAAKSLAATG
jgi:hypothetical protein